MSEERRRHYECSKPKGQLSHLQEQIGKGVTEVKKKLMRRYYLEIYLARDLGNLSLGSQPVRIFLGFLGLLVAASGRQFSGGRNSGQSTLAWTHKVWYTI